MESTKKTIILPKFGQMVRAAPGSSPFRRHRDYRIDYFLVLILGSYGMVTVTPNRSVLDSGLFVIPLPEGTT